MARQQNATAAAKLEVEGVQKLRELQTSALESDDLVGAAETYRQQADELVKGILQRAPEPVRPGLIRSLGKRIATQQASVRANAARRLNAEQLEAWQTKADVLAEEFAHGRNIHDLKTVVASLRESTDDLVKSGALDPEAALDLQRSAQANFAEQRVAAFINSGQYAPASEFVDKTEFLDEERKRILNNRIRAASNRATVSEGAELRSLTRDHLESIRRTGAGIPDFRARLAMTESKSDLKAFDSAVALARDVHETMETIRFAPPAEIVEKLEEFRPTSGSAGFAVRQQAFNSLQAMARKLLKDRAENPAAAAMARSDVSRRFENLPEDDPARLRQAIEYRMEAQKDMGIPEWAVRALPNAEAAQLAASFNQSPTASRVTSIRQLQETYGRLFPQVFQELVDAGVDPANKVLPMLMRDPAMAQTVATVIGVEKSELTEGLQSADVTAIRDNVREELTPLMRAIQRGAFSGSRAAEVNTLLNVVEKVALNEFRRTGNIGSAVKHAVEGVIENNLAIVEFADSALYVPRVIEGQAIDMARVEANAEALQTRTAIEEFLPVAIGASRGVPADVALEATISSAINSGVWVTSSDGTAAFLMVPLLDGSVVPLLNAEGERLRFSFVEATNTNFVIDPEPLEAPDERPTGRLNPEIEPRPADRPTITERRRSVLREAIDEQAEEARSTQEPTDEERAEAQELFEEAGI